MRCSSLVGNGSRRAAAIAHPLKQVKLDFEKARAADFSV